MRVSCTSCELKWRDHSLIRATTTRSVGGTIIKVLETWEASCAEETARHHYPCTYTFQSWISFGRGQVSFQVRRKMIEWSSLGFGFGVLSTYMWPLLVCVARIEVAYLHADRLVTRHPSWSRLSIEYIVVLRPYKTTSLRALESIMSSDQLGWSRGRSSDPTECNSEWIRSGDNNVMSNRRIKSGIREHLPPRSPPAIT
jgi:hypothetical protein